MTTSTPTAIPKDTKRAPVALPPAVLAMCSNLDAKVRAIVQADSDPARQARLRQQARRLEARIRADVRARLP